MIEGQDGVDYINIYSKGQTPLGRSLSNFSDCHIEISIGYFRTIEGLIFYLQSFDERFRTLNGPAAKELSGRIDRRDYLPEKIFKRFIIEAMWNKIGSDVNLKNALKESSLPFTHYYNVHGKKIFIPEWDWQIREWEKIRQQLREDIY